jgi:DNA (cytosine-5)-methyltransferase 1
MITENTVSVKKLTVGSLFSGIGGFDLGFERAGMEIKYQVEIDPFCQKVLAKHFPDAKRYGDIRTIETLDYVDVICGGFPCQDISGANPNGQGLDGERSGLWYEFARIIRAVKPRWVVVENVARLLSINNGRDFGIVLADLASSGYDAEWDVLPAAAFGAPHLRERVFIVAHAQSDKGGRIFKRRMAPHFRASGQDVANATGTRFPKRRRTPVGEQSGAVAQLERRNRTRGELQNDAGFRTFAGWWAVEPNVGRVADGVPARVDRLKGLGNAVVPQIAEWIGNRIVMLDSASAT